MSSGLHGRPLSVKRTVKAWRHLTADQQSVVFNVGSLIQLVQVEKGDVAEPFGVALDGGLLEGLQVWFSLHHLHVVLTLGALVQDGEADGALERPRQLPVEGSLHGVDKEGDVVGAARGVGGLQV